jgi:hypothetical protein
MIKVEMSGMMSIQMSDEEDVKPIPKKVSMAARVSETKVSQAGSRASQKKKSTQVKEIPIAL